MFRRVREIERAVKTVRNLVIASLILTTGVACVKKIASIKKQKALEIKEEQDRKDKAEILRRLDEVEARLAQLENR